jgi:uncharacterized protein (TIGR03118 family)
MSTRNFPWSGVACAALTLLTIPAFAQDNSDPNSNAPNAYQSKVLVSNAGMSATFTDPNLINGWGVAFNPTGPVWVNANGTGKALLFDGTGQPQSLVVTIPGPGGAASSPTGIVFAGGMDFVLTSGNTNGPARFLFATQQGTIAGWGPNVDATNAVTMVDNSASKASYTGLTLGGNGTTHLLYAANFSQARVDVFDGTFKSVNVPGGFKDPNLPANFAPFGIQAINGDIYVTYAKQAEPGGSDEAHGAGLGVVNVFDPQGNLIRRIAAQGPLNAPWGMALAPASFGAFGGALLVGNLGDGKINAFDPRTGTLIGTLNGSNNQPLVVDGLWGLQFGNGIDNQPTNSLFWAAGPNDEKNGAFGVITVATSSSTPTP